jgi:outer membrane protein OmpA-like peptidoglycan-associated protein
MAILHELSPSWLHEEPEESEFSVPLEAGTQPITLAGVHSRWMLNTLARGRMGSFDFKEGEEAWTKVRVSISPVNFQKPYTEFRNCTKRLVSAKREMAGVHDVRFPTDVSALSRKARANLKRLIKTALAEKDVTEVSIRGHADSVGKKGYNQGLSARRAESVSRYLTWNGLQGKKISVQAYGETRPKQDNASKAGRAANRRVELELIRDPMSTATP